MGTWSFPKNAQIENIDEVIELFYRVNEDTDGQIDFSLESVERLTPFIICYWRFFQDFAFKKVKNTRTMGPRGNQLVYEFGKLVSDSQDAQSFLNGFAEKLGLSEINSIPIIDFKKNLKLQDQGRLRKQILDFVKNQIGLHFEISYLIYHCLKEVIDNSFSHSKSDFGSYACAVVDKNADQINICILDNGIGIHKSLSEKYNNILNSADAIKNSVGFLVSRFNDPDRGRGLFTLQHSIEMNRGRLIIVSGDGYYEYNAISHEPTEAIIHTLDNSFQGAIIDISIRNNPDYRFIDDLMEEIL